MLLEATKVHKLWSERRTGIARDWLASDEATNFVTDRSAEMIISGTQICTEKLRLAAAQLRSTLTR